MRKIGFTLIELLIVVAIIAILAAIAVPNFLESQTRSKVSRVKADLRTIDVALSAYQVDNNRFPRQPGSQTSVIIDDGLVELTTPVAYITAYPTDVFRAEGGGFHPLLYSVSGGPYLSLHLWSFGPDKKNDYFEIAYDPTNGSVSKGDVVRRLYR